ncbi:cation diffusion facilitator family transporter [Clostridium acidisoli DSM 12555]|uniref:Cation diffusion facilitator family transporter n=1 Tax=Clostridium acidisoli DSM 12555 TaxID=1121291 RepID=A0A1W1XMZ1_9CLOT|nr:cation diffusion facilitator family transporter [Clostridium acidisoli]SMC25232.1 cation diffusion facilitator family transporter [Clostridium acidisoli DSM 12555]
MTAKFIISHFIKNHEDIKNRKVRQQYGTVSGVIGIVVNLILFIIEIILGVLTNSIAIIGDAVHNLADVTSSIVTLVGFKLSNRPADKEHPFGHGRMEYISALVVSFLILVVGLQFVKTSFDRILHPQEVSYNIVTFLIIICAIPLKLWLSYFNKSLGKIINSATLEASGADALNDVAILGGVIISLAAGYAFKVDIDGYVGLVVAVFILLSGLSLVKETLNPLLGQAPDPELVKEIKTSVTKYDHILGIHDLIIHNYGPGRSMASLHAEVPYNISIMKIHEVIDRAEKELSKKLNMFIVIHMDPVYTDSKEVNDARKTVVKVLQQFPIVDSLHDFRIVGEGENKNLIFDIVISFDNKVTDEEEEKLKLDIDAAVKVEHPGYDTVITIDRDYTT